MKALTIQDIRQWAIDKGGKFLSKEFFGRDTEHTWRCDKGHVFDLRPRFVQRGAWCPQCTIHDKKIAGLELMREWAEKRGEKCLSKVYINSETPLEWECKNGHRFKKTRDFYKQHTLCVQCKHDEIRKRNLIKIQKIATKKFGKCLSKEYFDLDTKLKFECKLGHKWETTPINIIYANSWCPHCYGKIKKTIEYMQELAANKKGKCISKNYINSVTPLKWQCDKGHLWTTPATNIISGTWCPTCHLIKVKTTDIVKRWTSRIT